MHQFDFVSDIPVDDITAAPQSSSGQRKVNYHDVYNQMKKVRLNKVRIRTSIENVTDLLYIVKHAVKA